MNETGYYCELESPLGTITLEGDGTFLTGLFMPQHKWWNRLDAARRRDDEPFAAAHEQLTEYFAGRRREFDVPLKLHGTDFQRRVWQQLVRIPFGETISYAELARRVGNAAACRAVGAANGRNPISILVPCHRVIGAGGKLTGYGGGLENKERLLAWERESARIPQLLS